MSIENLEKIQSGKLSRNEIIKILFMEYAGRTFESEKKILALNECIDMVLLNLNPQSEIELPELESLMELKCVISSSINELFKITSDRKELQTI